MGGVWIGFDPDIGDLVAVKTLFEELKNNENAVERFKREIDLVRRLDHPNIVKYMGSGQTERTWYLAQEYIRGLNLAQILYHGEPLPPPDAVAITCGILEALDHAHEQRIIHRDVKPSNIMVTSDGRVPKILDFGVAHFDATSVLTATGDIVGTFAYASPEQNQGRVVDGRSDVYSLGLTLYEMLTGARPYEVSTHQAMVAAQLTKAAMPPSQRRIGVPAALDPIVMKMIQPDTEARYRTAAQVLADLQPFLENPETGGDTRTSVEEYPELLKDFQKAQAALVGGDPETAMRICDLLSASAPRASEIWAVRGESRARVGDYYKAVEDLKKAIGLKPDEVSFHIELASTYGRMGMAGLAREAAQNVFELDPDNAVMAQVLAEIERADEAGELAPAPASVALGRGELDRRYLTDPGRPGSSPAAVEVEQPEIELDPEEMERIHECLNAALPPARSPLRLAAPSVLVWGHGFAQMGHQATARTLYAAQLLLVAILFVLLRMEAFVPPSWMVEHPRIWAKYHGHTTLLWLLGIFGMAYLAGTMWAALEVLNGSRWERQQAYVMQVTQDEDGDLVVVLNVGRETGFEDVDRLDVYQEIEPGSGVGQRIGEVELHELHEEVSVGRFYRTSDRVTRVGDFVIPRGALNSGWIDPTDGNLERFPDVSTALLGEL